jgi:hypothetical protein
MQRTYRCICLGQIGSGTQKETPMQKPQLMRHEGETVLGLELDPRTIGDWSPTVAQVRDAILGFHVTGPDWTACMDLPAEAKQFVPNQREVEAVNDMCHRAVLAGRLVDFGTLPNEVIMQGGDRGGPLWNQGAIGMPFSDPWVFMHQWEGGVAVYLVNPGSDDFEVCELSPISFQMTERMLVIGDRGQFNKVPGMLAEKRYHCSVAPSAIRYVGDAGLYSKANNGGRPQEAAAGNIGDPVMAALLILNTRNVERETVRAPEKLQRARARSNKKPIPPHDVVLTAPYVTAILARGKPRPRSDDKGGTHASPIFHIRMGHPRNYTGGRTIFIHDTLVNASEEQRAAFKSNRSHYAVRP